MSNVTDYSPDEHKPLGGYAILTLVFNAAVAAFVAARSRSRHTLPNRIPLGDIAMLGVATFKISRLIAKDKVTSFIRAPFTRYEGEAGPAEVSEEPRGDGLKRAVGELLVCPYCIGQWVGTGLLASYLYRPRLTRTVASVFAIVTAADYLQQTWSAVDKRA
jgi:Protein of unknown function (DUF1360)